MIDGLWPWESGEMSEQEPAVELEDGSATVYHLPKIRDRKTGKMRAITVQERFRQMATEDEVSPHEW